MKKLLISLLLMPALPLLAEIQFVDGSADNAYMRVQRSVSGVFEDVVTLAPGQSFQFQPWDGYTNNVFAIAAEYAGGSVTAGSNVTVYDGDVISLDLSDNVLQHSGLLDNATARDQAWCGYLTMGLESGSGLAAILLGFMAVRRALGMGEQWD